MTDDLKHYRDPYLAMEEEAFRRGYGTGVRDAIFAIAILLIFFAAIRIN